MQNPIALNKEVPFDRIQAIQAEQGADWLSAWKTSSRESSKLKFCNRPNHLACRRAKSENCSRTSLIPLINYTSKRSVITRTLWGTNCWRTTRMSQRPLESGHRAYWHKCNPTLSMLLFPYRSSFLHLFLILHVIRTVSMKSTSCDWFPFSTIGLSATTLNAGLCLNQISSSPTSKTKKVIMRLYSKAVLCFR